MRHVSEFFVKSFVLVITVAAVALFFFSDRGRRDVVSKRLDQLQSLSEKSQEAGLKQTGVTAGAAPSISPELSQEVAEEVDQVVEQAIFKKFGPDFLKQKIDQEQIETEQLPLAPI
jgi:pyruvate/oxaloacetate carboxyltransferase